MLQPTDLQPLLCLSYFSHKISLLQYDSYYSNYIEVNGFDLVQLELSVNTSFISIEH